MTEDGRSYMQEILGSEGWRHITAIFLKHAGAIRLRLLQGTSQEGDAQALRLLRHSLMDVYTEAALDAPSSIVTLNQ